jgi:hypothetical protein
MADKPSKGVWARIVAIWQAMRSPVTAIATRIDPVAQAAQLPEIKAAARSWRMRLASAPVDPTRRMSTGVILKASLSEAELDAFEKALVLEFASAKTYCPSHPVFTEGGLEVTVHLGCAARAAGIREKIEYFGWMSRMRILPTSVDHEVGEWTEYRHCNWENTWTKAEAA